MKYTMFFLKIHDITYCKQSLDAPKIVGIDSLIKRLYGWNYQFLVSPIELIVGLYTIKV